MGRVVLEETAEARYEVFKQQERGLSESGRLELWAMLPEETREEFASIGEQRKKRQALRNYALGILGVVAAEAAGIACLVVFFVLSPHGTEAQALVLAASILITLAWIPPWHLSRSARYDLIGEL
jgi:hypothetical protein